RRIIFSESASGAGQVPHLKCTATGPGDPPSAPQKRITVPHLSPPGGPSLPPSDCVCVCVFLSVCVCVCNPSPVCRLHHADLPAGSRPEAPRGGVAGGVRRGGGGAGLGS